MINVAIAGVGNCCSSLYQGIYFHSDSDPIINNLDISIKNINVKSAYDVDCRKVGLPISKAILVSYKQIISLTKLTRPTKMAMFKVCTKRGHFMEKVNIYDDKINLSKIIQEVIRTGESIVIAKNGHALVKVIAYRKDKPKRKLGFLKGKGSVPTNFDDMNSTEVINMFEGKYS